MGVTTTKTNKPLNPRGNDQSPLAFNRAKLFSGKALSFDGVNDYIQADGVNETLDNYTLSWNLKTTSTQNYSNIFSNSTNVIDIYITSNGQLRFYTDQGYNSTNLPPVNDGQWKNFVLSISGTSLNIYVNGVLSETLSINDVSRSIANIRLGYIFSNLYAFNGEMAGFKIFNTALTAAQVADLYNNPEKVVPTGVDNTALKLWLPMMEGAGTTAYDGSGNGNHGTISGATYVNGIGAPVAQSAVMDWNKGVNLLQYSEGFDDVYWPKLGASVSANQVTAPDGSNTGFSLIEDASGNPHQIQATGTLSTSVTYNVSVFAKAHSSGRFLQFAGLGLQAANEAPTFDLVNGLVSTATNTTTLKSASIEDAGNGWYRCSSEVYTTGAANFVLVVMNNFNDHAGTTYTGDGTSRVHIWGAQVVQQATLDPYVRTGATAQTSPVLLPQGLTTGRDITGVNLFENVRKQGALNLDGNSWAEVHDNASLDITTAITLEAWVQIKDGMVADGVLGRWSSSLGYLLYLNASNDIRFYVNGLDTRYTSLTNGWRHIVGLYDGSAKKLYVDGVQVSSSSQSVGAAASTAPIEIGRYQQSTGNTIDGPIAQPRIYNRALTAEEVQRSYDSGKNIYTNS